MKTEIVSAVDDAAAVGRAVELLRRGEAIGLPTETVYGLAANALREEAVLKIFTAKERPRFDPLIVHLPDVTWVDRVTVIPDAERKRFELLQKQFWPGPITFVWPRRPIVPDIVTAGLETVAIRVSAHPVFSRVISEFGGPLAAPSANRFGRISPTTAEHVHEELNGLIPLIVDAGLTGHGLESTIVALRNGRIEILRRGPVSQEQLEEFGEVVVRGAAGQVEVPGQLPTHYAPTTRLILADDPTEFIPTGRLRHGLLAWKTATAAGFTETLLLSRTEDLAEAARNLFRFLRELDNQQLDLIVAERLPDKGLGAAINDRLERAASR